MDLLIGKTPLEKIQLGEFYTSIKREDLNPSGSFKDRSLFYAVKHYQNLGINRFCISSSGNAGISLANIAKHAKIKAEIFMGNNIASNKLAKLSEIFGLTNNYFDNFKNSKFNLGNIAIQFSENPKSGCIRFAQDHKEYKNLRSSLDDNLTIGYESLGKELVEFQFSDVIMLVSSGCGVTGIANYFIKNNLKMPKFHIIQTPKVHPIIRFIDPSKLKNLKEGESLINCIVDTIGARKKEIKEIMMKSNGSCQLAYDNDIITFTNRYYTELQNYKLLSVNQVAPLMIAKTINAKEELKNPVVIISGI